jgi:hypothetical protein
MTDAHRPGDYLEFREAACAILSRQSGDAALAAFGLTELLDGAAPGQDLTPVYAFLEAQGFRVSSSSALGRLGLVGHGSGPVDVATDTMLGWPMVGGSWAVVPGWQPNQPVALDRPGQGLVVAAGRAVRPRTLAGPVADDYLAMVSLDPDDAVLALDEHAMAECRAATLAQVQLGAAAEILGLVSRILSDAIAYTRVRRQFGHSISSFQVVQHLLAWAATERHQLESMYDIAVDHTVHYGPDRLLSASVKALAGRALHAIAQTAIQVTGGISFTWEYSLNRPHQRALGLDQFAGSSADLVLALGREVRASGRFPQVFGLSRDTSEASG